jgi:hypothetical protein
VGKFRERNKEGAKEGRRSTKITGAGIAAK